MIAKRKLSLAVGALCLTAMACTTTSNRLPPPPPVEPETTIVKDILPKCAGATYQIYFAPDKTSLDDTAKGVIAELSDHSGVCKPKAIEITGHTDSTGPQDVNLRISQARADAVLAAILEADLNIERIKIVAVGERDAITEDGLVVPNNRRVEVVFVN